ncbi:MAG: hypothetical protein RMM58_05480 [Chloroflexota bacterium]|nr:hypothetical protein [Dehalococcoidia bacterium]MDW8253312.1 hypothetical protein [Chloroflexota bacterium]
MDPRSSIRNNSPQWMDSIPGYRGYKRKELRREADRALRMYLAGKLEAQQRRLDEAKLKLLEAGGLSRLSPFERASTKLRTLIDTIKSASYGYAGLFDSDAVREPQLDALYEFDRALDAEIDALGAKIEAVRAAVLAGADPAADLATVLSEADALLSHLETRHHAILTGTAPPELSPRSVLEPQAVARPEFLALRQLRINDAVAAAGMNAVVSAREQATVNGTTYFLFRLDSGAQARWLWVGPTERDIALLDPYSPRTDLFKDEQVAVGSDLLRLVNRGYGSVNLDGPSGTRRDVPAQIALFRSDLQVLWAERLGPETLAFLGIVTDLATIQQFRR